MRMSLADMYAELVLRRAMLINRTSVKSNLVQHVYQIADEDEHREIVNRIAEFEKEITWINARISKLSADIRAQEGQS